MNRRILLSISLGIAVAFGPLISPAADPAPRVVRLGFVGPLSPSTLSFAPFWQRLRELGWIEGENLLVERRTADGHLERLPGLIADVIDRKPDVLVTYGMPGAIAARKATSTIPVVAWAMVDPVRSGVVASLARPGGNVTGLATGYAQGFAGKFLEFLHEVVPQLSSVAVIVNPDNAMSRLLTQDLENDALARGLKLRLVELRSADALERAFESAGRRSQAVVVIGEPITLENMKQTTTLAAKYRLPAIYLQTEYVQTGGLLSYGPDFSFMWRRAGDYVDKVLRGANPADLPIEQPTRYVLSVNLKAAKALGIAIPESILLRADEVIR